MTTPVGTSVPGPGVPAPGPFEPDRQVPRPPRRRRRRLVGAVVVVAVAAAVAVVAVADPVDSTGESPGGADSGIARATVREGPLSAQVQQNGTLSYAAQRRRTPYSAAHPST